MSKTVELNNMRKGLPDWVDLVLFKISWLLLVLGQEQGVFPALGLIAVKLLLYPPDRKILAFLVFAFIIGIGMDLLLVATSVFEFVQWPMPTWLLVLWCSFTLTLLRGFSFMRSMALPWQAFIGALAGVAGYMAGYMTNAVEFGYTLPLTLLVIALCWSVLVPFLYRSEMVLAK